MNYGTSFGKRVAMEARPRVTVAPMLTMAEYAAQENAQVPGLNEGGGWSHLPKLRWSAPTEYTPAGRKRNVIVRKTTTERGSVYAAIIEAMTDAGPMTSNAIAEKAGLLPKQARGVISRLRTEGMLNCEWQDYKHVTRLYTLTPEIAPPDRQVRLTGSPGRVKA